MNLPILPGYWRAMAAGWHPDPPVAGNHPNPPLAGNHPNPPGSSTHPNPPGSSSHPVPPVSANGADDWASATGDDAWLLAEALRTTRNRIVRPLPARGASAVAGIQAGGEPALWRWQRPFREAAVLTELMGLFVVDGLRVWWMPGIAELQSGQSPAGLFQLQPPAADFIWDDQVDKVLRAAVEREDRMAEVLSQRHDFSPFFDALTGIDQTATRRLCELLTVAANLATQVVMALKNTAAVWRPVQRSALVQPMIATPGHGSLPSGHATVAAMNATLLSALLYTPGDERIAQLDALARRIAFNRVVAGVHFPIDSLAGYLLGRQLAQSLLAAAGQRARPKLQPFTAASPDAQLRENDPPPNVVADDDGAVASAERAPLFSLLWQASAEELRQLRI